MKNINMTYKKNQMKTTSNINLFTLLVFLINFTMCCFSHVYLLLFSMQLHQYS